MRLYVFSLLLVVVSSNLIANDFIPVQNGNNWAYETDYDQSTMPARIHGRDGNWTRLTYLFGLEEQWVWSVDGESDHFLWNGTDYELLFNSDAAVGTQYPISVIPGATYAEISARSMAATSAGDFNTLTLTFGPTNGRGPIVRSVTFARGVGVLAWTYMNPVDGLSTFSLKACRVAGQNMSFSTITTTPEPTAAVHSCTVSAAFDKNFDYTPICPMGQWGCELDPVSVGVQLTITNTGTEEMVYNFTSGRYYDIEILDDQNQVLSRWSEGRLFLQYLWEQRIAAGETWTIADRIEFRDNNGNLLIGGDYTIRFTMKSITVTAPFTLQQVMN
jgi:hypothetical protein